MEFRNLKEMQQVHIQEIWTSQLFTVDVDKDVLYNLYLDSFPTGTNEIYRKRREFDCGCCKSFIRNVGNVVTIKEGAVRTIWGFRCGDSVYQPVLDALDRMVSSAPINGIFVTKETSFGTNVSREVVEGDITTWHHFYTKVPKSYVYNGNKTIESIMGDARTNREVFERSLQEISPDSIEIVLDLISQNSLYKGEEWLENIRKLSVLQREFLNMGFSLSDLTLINNWCWEKSVKVGPVISGMKNSSIGVLLIDLTKGDDLETALKKYMRVVDPHNYKRPTAPIRTSKMINEAKKTIIEMGLMDSLPRRFARLDDISINDVLFADRSVKLGGGGDVFDKLSKSVPVNIKSFDKVEEVGIDAFVNDILPRASGVQVLVENRHIPNLVSLIAPQNQDAKSILKWNNNFSWAYNGNIADSAIKDNVLKFGGKVVGPMRFSIQWNEKGDNNDDLDAHCIQPNNRSICFQSKRGISGGELDVDIIYPANKVAVENIIWNELPKMYGIYVFHVHCYSNHRPMESKSGFKAEIELNGTVYQYEHTKPLRQGERVVVARVRYSANGGLELLESMFGSTSSKECWGITTGHFTPVLAVMHSPNYWGESKVGNRHTIFALKGCINPDTPNGFFNEYLTNDLLPHKRVFEALGKEMSVEHSDNQVSGLGFSSTKRNHVIIKVSGHVERIIKVNF